MVFKRQAGVPPSPTDSSLRTQKTSVVNPAASSTPGNTSSNNNNQAPSPSTTSPPPASQTNLLGVPSSNSSQTAPSATYYNGTSAILTTGSTTISAGSSATTTQAQNSTPKSGGHHSNGVLAGAVVGSVIGSALLAFLATCLFFRSRRSKRRNPEGKRMLATGKYEEESHEFRDHLRGGLDSSSSQDKVTAPVTVTADGGRASLGNYIPSPADDKTVQNRVLTIFEQVALHVENYYSNNPPIYTQDAAALESYNSPFLPVSMLSLLSRPGGRIAVLKHCLTRTLLSATLPTRQSEQEPGGECFLPPMYAVRKDFEETAEDPAQFHWRMLTAYMYRRMPENQKQAYTAARKREIVRTVKRFTATFLPYSNPLHPEEVRTRHLIDVMQGAADLGIWLFEQPCGFEFVWDVAASRIVVSPAMVKVADEQGRRLQVEQKMVDAETVGL